MEVHILLFHFFIVATCRANVLYTRKMPLDMSPREPDFDKILERIKNYQQYPPKPEARLARYANPDVYAKAVPLYQQQQQQQNHNLVLQSRSNFISQAGVQADQAQLLQLAQASHKDLLAEIDREALGKLSEADRQLLVSKLSQADRLNLLTKLENGKFGDMFESRSGILSGAVAEIGATAGEYLGGQLAGEMGAQLGAAAGAYLGTAVANRLEKSNVDSLGK